MFSSAKRVPLFNSVKLPLLRSIILCASVAITCCENSSGAACINPTEGTARLVAYRVAKHSHLWLEDVETKLIYDISGVGGRRKPAITLGISIHVRYCSGKIDFDKYSVVKEPVNRDARFVSLPGYEYVYQ